LDDEHLDRRMRDWKQSEMLAREAERAAAAAPEATATALAQRAAQLRRIADVILASILEDLQGRRGNADLPSSALFTQDPAGPRPS
jgi:hypothetical protein